MGRPSKYEAKFCGEIRKFFDIPLRRNFLKKKTIKPDGTILEEYAEKGADLPFISGFARAINVNTSTLYEWAEKHEEFSNALKEANELQTEMVAKNALCGAYQQIFSIFTLKNISDWRDKREIDLQGDLKFDGDTDINEAYKKYSKKVLKALEALTANQAAS